MSVSLGLRHTMQKRVTDSVQYGEKKKKKEKSEQTAALQLAMNTKQLLTHSCNNYRLLFACSKHSWQAVAVSGGISVRGRHLLGSCKYRSQSGKPLTHARNQQARHKSYRALVGLQKAAPRNTNIPAHGSVRRPGTAART